MYRLCLGQRLGSGLCVDVSGWLQATVGVGHEQIAEHLPLFGG
jgi:hypothetical protein